MNFTEIWNKIEITNIITYTETKNNMTNPFLTNFEICFLFVSC